MINRKWNYSYLMEILETIKFTKHMYLIYVYKEGLALNNLQWLICHKPNQNKSYIFHIYVSRGFGIK